MWNRIAQVATLNAQKQAKTHTTGFNYDTPEAAKDGAISWLDFKWYLVADDARGAAETLNGEGEPYGYDSKKNAKHGLNYPQQLAWNKNWQAKVDSYLTKTEGWSTK
jgi:hypothetical protein